MPQAYLHVPRSFLQSTGALNTLVAFCERPIDPTVLVLRQHAIEWVRVTGSLSEEELIGRNRECGGTE
jgi:hypothetical protein